MPTGKEFARKIARRARAVLAAARGAPLVGASAVSAALELPDVPRPVPGGCTEENLRAVMATFRIDGSPEEELIAYLEDAYWRFLHTWGLVRHERGRALELGANPYYITWLLQEFTDLDVELANYFGDDRDETVQTLAWRTLDDQPHERTLHSSLFNMEETRFPYDDGAFDVVLFCEIIEHLLMNPLHALGEIHRVLKPGGLLVLTTPNVARLGNVLALVAGENVYDPYSGYGPYGRHNREYTMHEIVHLLGFAGFTAQTTFTADAHPEGFTHRTGYDTVNPAVRFRRNDLGQYLFVAARATHAALEGLPSFLYRSYPADVQMVDVFESPAAAGHPG